MNTKLLFGVLSLLLATASASGGRGAEISMSFPAEEWAEAEPESQGVDSEKLEEAVAYLRRHSGRDGVNQLVIVRNGVMIWSGSGIDDFHGVWSLTKSFTSTALGLLVEDGKCELDTAAAQFLPELATAYPRVALRHFATMTSGYRAVGDEPRGGYSHGPSLTPFDPAPQPLFEPGSKYAYWDSAMNQFANVLTRVAGESLEELFERRIAGPIGMDRERWDWHDFGDRAGLRGVAVNGGSGNSGKHLWISPRELARFGHLFLNRGRWEDRQLIEADWVDAATSVQVPASLPWGHAESGIDGRGVYGLNWWVNATKAGGGLKWPDAPAGTYAASGYNNNDLFVIPEWNLVVVRLGLDQRDRKITDEDYSAFLGRIGAAIEDRGVATIAATRWRVESPRKEIAPRAWKDDALEFDGRPTLALSGRGVAAVNGWWTAEFDVEPGEPYRFETHYRARRVEEPLRCVLARVVWRDGDGKAIGRAEYPATVAGPAENGWTAIRQTYESPETADRAQIELVYRWDADGVVNFSAVTFARTAAPQPRLVRLASVHHRPRRSDGPQANLEAFGRFIARAAENKADIVCLPEGITVVGTGKSYVDVSEPIPGPSTRFLGELCKKHQLYVVAGIYERDGGAVHNTAVLIDPDGEIAGKYRKVCLPREEIQGGITPGDRLPVFDTKFGRVGLMICWDVFFPEPARELARKGAEVIFLPIWGGNLTLARARAIENQVYLVSSTYDMKTAVFDREGEIVAEGTDDDPVIVVEVDLEKRKLWPWLGDFRSRIPREGPTVRALGE